MPELPAEEAAARWRALATLLLLLLAEGHQAHQAEQETARRDRALERDSFLDLAAHELRTPVAVIKAYAELLEAQLAEAPIPPAVRQVVRHILEQADHMTALIEDVLDVQRLRRGKLSLEIGRVDLAALAREVAEDIQQTTRAHCIRVQADTEPLVISADRRRLRRVLVNLVENAVKFSEGGDIMIRVRAEQRDGRVLATVAVHDQGIGIAPGDLQRIFERFEQLSGAPVHGHVGLGLGLYIARQIAQAHGGDVVAASGGLGQGSTFTLTLPAESAAAL